MAKAHQPSSSFGTELLSVLREGANKRIELTFETVALAIRFTSRINALRAAMKREKHPDTDRLYRAGVYLQKGSNTVIIQPKDSEFREVIEAAHITVDPLPELSHYDVETPKPGVEEDPATLFLSTLTEATSVPREAEAPRPPSDKVDEKPQNPVANGDK
jgi:hypothetical protein